MLFFFYGTLVAGSVNATAQAVHRRLRPLGAATARGRLHAIGDPAGWYPALTPGDDAVHGRLYETLPTFDAAALAALDAYENFDPAQPDASDYLRRGLRVRDDDGHTRMAQAYLWRPPIPANAREVPGGDFAAWIARNGLPAYR